MENSMNPPPIPTAFPEISSEVAELLRSDAQEHPSWPDMQNRWGLLLLRSGNHAEARAVFARCLEINPRYGWAVLNHIQALALEGDVETARRLLTDAPEAAPGTRSAVHGFLDLCDPDSSPGDPLAGLPGNLLARPDFQRLRAALESRDRPPPDLRLFVPGLHQLFREAGIWEARLGNLDRAVELAGSMLSVWHDLGVYWSQRGFFASLQGKDEESLHAYQEAARIAPESPEALIAIAYYWSALGEAEHAHAALSEALRRAPRFADLHYQMGLLQSSRGETQTALALNPNYTVARLQEAEALSALELWVQAREAYVRVLDAGLQSTDLFLRLGQVEEHLDRPARAEEAYRAALRLNPHEPLGHYRLGRLHRDRGDREKAKRAWRRYLVLAGETELADAIRAEMEEDHESWGV